MSANFVDLDEIPHPVTPPPFVLPDPHAALPALLHEALIDYANHNNPHVSGPISLPYPAIRVYGLRDQLVLPLLPVQANALLNIANSADYFFQGPPDCFQIPADSVNFENPAWGSAVCRLVVNAAQSLGVDARFVSTDFCKLELFRSGGQFGPQRDTDLPSGVFGTFIIQLPSRFEGGQFIFRHRGSETVLDAGADDGTCAFTTFFTAYFADLEHEMRPITQGWRLCLVYNLCWLGDGAAPLLDDTGMTEVVEKLLDHAEEAKDEQNRWYIAFGLEERYIPLFFLRSGLSALRGQDIVFVDALREAGRESESVGEMDVVLCTLKRLDTVSFTTAGIELQRTAGNTTVCTAYRENGTLFYGSLKFVIWNDVAERACFEKLRESEPTLGQDGNITKTVTYMTNAVVLWPKKYAISLNYTPTSDVEKLFEIGHGDSTGRILTMLDCCEAAGAGPNAWTQVESILGICLKMNFCSPVCRAIRFAATLDATPLIEFTFVALLRKFGWAIMRSTMDSYFLPQDVTLVATMEQRLTSIVHITTLPKVFLGRCIAKIIEHIRVHNSFVGVPSDSSAVRITNKKSMWSDLLSTILNFPAACQKSGLSTEGFMSEIEEIVPRLGGEDFTALCELLSSRFIECEKIRKLRMTLAVCRADALLYKSMLTAAKNVFASSALSHENELIPRNETCLDWHLHLLFLDDLFCEGQARQDSTQYFEMFLRFITFLSKGQLDDLRTALNQIGHRSSRYPLSEVKQVCEEMLHFKSVADEPHTQSFQGNGLNSSSSSAAQEELSINVVMQGTELDGGTSSSRGLRSESTDPPTLATKTRFEKPREEYQQSSEKNNAEYKDGNK